MEWEKGVKNEALKNDIGVLRAELLPVAAGLGLKIIDIVLARHRASVQIRVIIFKKSGIGIDDCSRFHRAITPRLDLLYEGSDITIEVSSPGTERVIRDGAELQNYLGCAVQFYIAAISDWKSGVLKSANEREAELQTANGKIEHIPLCGIAKAKLDYTRIDKQAPVNKPLA